MNMNMNILSLTVVSLGVALSITGCASTSTESSEVTRQAERNVYVDCTIGEVRAFASSWVPYQYLVADGRTLSVRDYAALALMVGANPDRETFTLPDFSQATLVDPNGVQISPTDGSATPTWGVCSEGILDIDHAKPIPTCAGSNSFALLPVGRFEQAQRAPSPVAAVGIPDTYGWYACGSETAPATYATLMPFAGTPTVRGWRPADGAQLPLDDATSVLFSLIGFHYGGDGQTTYNVPDVKSGPDAVAWYIAESGDNQYPQRVPFS